MRIRGTDTATLQANGVDTDGAIQSASKLQELVKSLTGFDIVDSSGTGYKSLYDTIIGIGKKWNTLDDIQQAGLLEALAGKNQGNALAAALDNYKMIENAYSTAQNSEGSAQREEANYKKSIGYSLERFTATGQETLGNIFDSAAIKNIISLLTKVVDVIGNIVSKVGVLGTAVTAVSAIISKKTGKGLLELNKVTGKFQGLIPTIAEAVQDRNDNAFIEKAKGASGNVGNVNVETLYKPWQKPTKETKEKVSAVLDQTVPAYDKNSQLDKLKRSSSIREKRKTDLDFYQGLYESTSNAPDGTGLHALFSGKDGDHKSIDTIAKEANASEQAVQNVKNAFDSSGDSVSAFGGQLGGLVKSGQGVVGMLGGIGKSLLSMGAEVAIPMAIAAGITALIKVLDRLIVTQKEAKAGTKDVIDSYSSKMSDIQNTRSTVSDLTGKYQKLSKGVNPATNKNKTLSEEDYKTYLDTANELGKTVPSAVRGYDSKGNVILKGNGSTKSINNALDKEQRQDMQTLYKGERKSNTDVGSVLTNYNYSKADDQRQKSIKNLLSKKNLNNKNLSYGEVDTALVGSGISTDSYLKALRDKSDEGQKTLKGYQDQLKSTLQTMNDADDTAMTGVRDKMSEYMQSKASFYKDLTTDQQNIAQTLVNGLQSSDMTQFTKTAQDKITYSFDNLSSGEQQTRMEAGVDRLVSRISDKTSTLGKELESLQAMSNNVGDLNDGQLNKMADTITSISNQTEISTKSLEDMFGVTDSLNVGQDFENIVSSFGEFNDLTAQQREQLSSLSVEQMRVYNQAYEGLKGLRQGTISAGDAWKAYSAKAIEAAIDAKDTGSSIQDFLNAGGKYNAAKNAQDSSTDVGSTYSSMYQMLKKNKKTRDRGDVGTNAFKATSAMFSPYGAETYQDWDKHEAKYSRYFKSENKSNSGMNNFLSDLKELSNADGSKMAELDSKTQQWTVHVGDLDAAVNKLGIGKEPLVALLDELSAKGFDVQYFDNATQAYAKLGTQTTELQQKESELYELEEGGRKKNAGAIKEKKQEIADLKKQMNDTTVSAKALEAQENKTAKAGKNKGETKEQRVYNKSVEASVNTIENAANGRKGKDTYGISFDYSKYNKNEKLAVGYATAKQLQDQVNKYSSKYGKNLKDDDSDHAELLKDEINKVNTTLTQLGSDFQVDIPGKNDVHDDVYKNDISTNVGTITGYVGQIAKKLGVKDPNPTSSGNGNGDGDGDSGNPPKPQKPSKANGWFTAKTGKGTGKSGSNKGNAFTRAFGTVFNPLYQWAGKVQNPYATYTNQGWLYGKKGGTDKEARQSLASGIGNVGKGIWNLFGKANQYATYDANGNRLYGKPVMGQKDQDKQISNGFASIGTFFRDFFVPGSTSNERYNAAKDIQANVSASGKNNFKLGSDVSNSFQNLYDMSNGRPQDIQNAINKAGVKSVTIPFKADINGVKSTLKAVIDEKGNISYAAKLDGVDVALTPYLDEDGTITYRGNVGGVDSDVSVVIDKDGKITYKANIDGVETTVKKVKKKDGTVFYAGDVNGVRKHVVPWLNKNGQIVYKADTSKVEEALGKLIHPKPIVVKTKYQVLAGAGSTLPTRNPATGGVNPGYSTNGVTVKNSKGTVLYEPLFMNPLNIPTQSPSNSSSGSANSNKNGGNNNKNGGNNKKGGGLLSSVKNPFMVNAQAAEVNFSANTTKLDKGVEDAKKKVKSVPAKKTTKLNGDNKNVNKASSSAKKNVKSVPGSHNTKFKGDGSNAKKTAGEVKKSVNAVPKSHPIKFVISVVTHIAGAAQKLIAKLTGGSTQVLGTFSVPHKNSTGGITSRKKSDRQNQSEHIRSNRGHFAGTLSSFAGGTNVALKHDETALVNELGQEGIIRNGKLNIIPGGMQTMKLRRGDVVINHKQLESLEKGQKTSRAKVVGGSSAFASGTIKNGMPSHAGAAGGGGGKLVGTDKSSSSSSSKHHHSHSSHHNSKSSSSTSKNTKATDKNTKSKNKNTKATDKNTKKESKRQKQADKLEKKFNNLYDWIERWESRVSSKISRYEDLADRQTKSLKYRNKTVNKELKTTYKAYKKSKKSRQAYLDQADKVGLSAKYEKMVKNGDYDKIQKIKDPVLKEKISEYESWWDKANQMHDQEIEWQKKVVELEQKRLDNIQQHYTTAISLVKSKGDIANSKAQYVQSAGGSMAVGSAYWKYLQKQVAYNNRQIELLQKEQKKYEREYKKNATTVFNSSGTKIKNNKDNKKAASKMSSAGIKWARKKAKGSKVGYSQSNRWGPTTYDCSSFVITATKKAGYDVGSASYTGDMLSNYKAHGWKAIKLKNNTKLKKGDILLTPNKHTEIYTGNGKTVGAHTANTSKANQVSERKSPRSWINSEFKYVLRAPDYNKKSSGGGGGSGYSTKHKHTGKFHLPKAVTRYGKYINKASKKYGVPADVIANMIYRESSGNPHEKTGSHWGLMQISPEIARQAGISSHARLNPEKNIMAGTRYLKQMIKKNGGNLSRGILSYRWGYAGSKHHSLKNSTYVKNALKKNQYTNGKGHKISASDEAEVEETVEPIKKTKKKAKKRINKYKGKEKKLNKKIKPLSKKVKKETKEVDTIKKNSGVKSKEYEDAKKELDKDAKQLREDRESLKKVENKRKKYEKALKNVQKLQKQYHADRKKYGANNSKTRKAQRSLDKAKENLRDVVSGADEDWNKMSIKKVQKRAKKRIDRYNKKIKKQKATVKKQQAKVDRDRGKLSEIEDSKGKNSKEYKAQKKTYDKDKAKLKKDRSKLKKTTSKRDKVDKALKKVRSTRKTYQADRKKYGKKDERTQKALTKLNTAKTNLRDVMEETDPNKNKGKGKGGKKDKLNDQDRQALEALNEMEQQEYDLQNTNQGLFKDMRDILITLKDYVVSKYSRTLERLSASLTYTQSKHQSNKQTDTETVQNAIDTAANLSKESEAKYAELQKVYDAMAMMNPDNPNYQEYADKANQLKVDIENNGATANQQIDAVVSQYIKRFEDKMQALSDDNSSAQHLIDLMGTDSFVDKSGNITDNGKAGIALNAVMINNNTRAIEDYRHAIEKVRDLQKKNSMTQEQADEYVQKYTQDIQELTSSNQQYKDSVISVYKTAIENENNLLQENINKRKEALTAKEDYYSYDKNIKKQNKDIQSLQAQIAALEGASGEAAKAKRLKLQEQLSEAQEERDDTIREHRNSLLSNGYDNLSNQLSTNLENTENALSNNMDFQAKVVQKMFDGVAKDSKKTMKTINDLVKDSGTQISTTLQGNINSLGDAKKATDLFAKALNGVDFDKILKGTGGTDANGNPQDKFETSLNNGSNIDKDTKKAKKKAQKAEELADKISKDAANTKNGGTGTNVGSKASLTPKTAKLTKVGKPKKFTIHHANFKHPENPEKDITFGKKNVLKLQHVAKQSTANQRDFIVEAIGEGTTHIYVQTTQGQLKALVTVGKKKGGSNGKTTTKEDFAHHNEYYKKYTGKSDSLTEALKAVGVDSSMKNRRKIAARNGIKNYTGTSAQNKKLLRLLKKGKLVKKVVYDEGATTTSGIDFNLHDYEDPTHPTGSWGTTTVDENGKEEPGITVDYDKKKNTAKYYKKYTGKSDSLIEALKAVGASSSMSSRKKIAKANGISNYTGSASQNKKLLSLLKKGKLKKIGKAKGGMINTVIPLSGLPNGDDGVITAKLGEAVLSKDFMQDVVPDFMSAVDKTKDLLKDSAVKPQATEISVHYDNLLNVEGNVDKDALPGLQDILKESYKYTSQKMYKDLKKIGL